MLVCEWFIDLCMAISKKNQVTQTFESAMARLEKIVEEMENAELPLEDILKRYEEGTELRKFCEVKLKEAEKRVQKVRPLVDGSPEIAEFEDGDDEDNGGGSKGEKGELLL